MLRFHGTPLCIVFLSSILISSLPASLGLGCNIPAIFNFGDSNSDTGADSAVFNQITAPNGETFFNTSAGRPCDGRLPIDFIAERLGFPLLSAYLDSLETNFYRGANFVASEATIRASNRSRTAPVPSPFYLDVQVSQLQQLRNRSHAIRSKGREFAHIVPRESFYPQALYTFDMGQNDVALGLFLKQSLDEIDIPDVIAKFSKNVKAVYDFGGRYFWIHNTSPIGCFAYVLTLFPVKDASELDVAGCATRYNNISMYFNDKLKEAVVALRAQLPSAHITYVDIYSIKYTLFSRGDAYGFEKPLLGACCGIGGKYNYTPGARCGRTALVDGKPVYVAPCANPKVRVNWDGSHLSEAANKFIFDQIQTGKFTDHCSQGGECLQFNPFFCTVKLIECRVVS